MRLEGEGRQNPGSLRCASDRPIVTIGLPVRNGERFLAPVLASLLGQDFGDFELLIGDNGSNDATEAICRTVADADRRVRYLRSPVDHGAAWNFNRLIPEARGEFFKWAADDDTCEPGFLGACVEALLDDLEAVVAIPRVREIGPHDEVLEERGPLNRVGPARPADRFRAALGEVYCYPVFGLIRTAVLRSTGAIGSYTSSDKVLLAELACHGHFVEIDDALFNHREHPGRSMLTHADDRERLLWFDPALAGRRVMPRWRVTAGYLAALRRAPLSPRDRLDAHGYLGRWALDNRRVLGREAMSSVLRPRRAVAALRSGR